MRTDISPRDFAEAIGVSESSVKRWVDQGVLLAVRTAGGHRRIPQDEALRFIREQQTRLLRPDRIGLVAVALAIPRDGSLRLVADELFSALAGGHAPSVRGILMGLHLAGQGGAAIADQVIKPAMERLGHLWRDGPAGIYLEHRATDLCRTALDELRVLLPWHESGRPAVVAGPADDPYQLAPLLVAFVLTELGWRVTSLGPETPLVALAHAAADVSARLICLSVTAEPEPTFARELDAFIAATPECIFALGGQSVASLALSPSPRVFIGADLEGLVAFTQRV